MNQQKLPPSLRFIDLSAFWLGVVILVAICWLYLIDMATTMNTMADMDMKAMPELIYYADIAPWQLMDFWNLFMMWAIMMIAMMVPTAARTLMIFARISQVQPPYSISPTYLFLTGYMLIWIIFSLAATLLQWQLDRAGLLDAMMVSSSFQLGAALLIFAGIYQFLPIKNACLRHCQSPIAYISSHFRPGYKGALNMGLRHGAFCLGCCWVLMLLLFVAGVMNLLWVLLITFFVLVEKLMPLLAPEIAPISTRITGTGLISAGLIFWFLNN